MGKDLFNPHLRKFSIRKLNVGVCSVLLSTLIIMGTAVNASADETSSTGEEQAAVQTSPAPDQTANSETAGPLIPAPSYQADAALAQTAAVQEPAQDQPQAESAAAESSASSEQAATGSETATAQEESQPAEEQRKTVGYPVRQVDTPETAAMPRSELNGQPMASGTGFRTAKTAAASASATEDATATPKVTKPTLADSENKKPEELMKQISWLDFGDPTTLSNLAPDGTFQVGTVYRKEVSPGYVVTLTVTDLKPFNSTEIYKNRVEGTGYESTYNPNAQNTWLTISEEYGKSSPGIIGAEQNQWTAIKDEGIDTQGRKTQLLVPKDSANYGVKFKVDATYQGRPVKATIVMADGEEANPGEFAIFTTNGAGWEYVAEWKRGHITETYTPTDQWITGQSIFNDSSVHWLSYLSPDQTTGGLGSQVFGPNVSKDRTVPIVMTRGASEVGFYVASSGQQAAMMGVMIVDAGDAPESYGAAYHTIATEDALTGARIGQPYLGTDRPDVDNETGNDWLADDKDGQRDEGLLQLLADEQLGTIEDLFRLDKLANGSYTLKVRATANGSDEAYMRAWIDFNANGRFDEDEASDIVQVTDTDSYTLTFSSSREYDEDIDSLGIRVRIALNQADIEKPTGTAFSGEVEDLRVLRPLPPSGQREDTYAFEGESQETTLRFYARGIERLNYDRQAYIDDSRAPEVIDENGQVLQPDASGWYQRQEGRYKLTAAGNDVHVLFEPNAGFTSQSTAQGLNVRRYDTNGASTNWPSKDPYNPSASDQLNSMDGRYVPHITKYAPHTSVGPKGAAQVKDLIFNEGDDSVIPIEPDNSRPARFLDAANNPINDTTVPATANGQTVGSYTLDSMTGQVTFQPNADFVGTADPVTVQVSDTGGLRSRATYQPTVLVYAEQTSTGPQGVDQVKDIVFNGDGSQTPVRPDSSHPAQFLDAAGSPVMDTTIPAYANNQAVGSYELDPATGQVTFKPNKDFVGTADAVVLQVTDSAGQLARATYQPTVTKVTPTATDAETTGLQGQVQEGKLTFTAGDAAVPLTGTPVFDNGQAVKTLAGVGSFAVAADGTVTFTPEKTFVGRTPEVEVSQTDANGTLVKAAYQATVTAVTPTSQNAVSEGIQGAVQTGQLIFEAGDDQVPIDTNIPPVFANGSQTMEVDGVGTYTVDNQGLVTFQPLRTYSGRPAAVTVTRVDTNGTAVTASYQAEVKPARPTSESAQSADVYSSYRKGDTQTGKLTFTPGSAVINSQTETVPFVGGLEFVIPSSTGVDPSKYEIVDSTTMKVYGGNFGSRLERDEDRLAGTYTLQQDGTVTFTPDPDLMGSVPPAYVQATDRNGSTTVTYFIPYIEFEVEGTATSGLQGQAQQAKISFEEYTDIVKWPEFEPHHNSYFYNEKSTEQGNEITEYKGPMEFLVPNVGTFQFGFQDSIATFTPEKTFVGTYTVKVGRTNELAAGRRIISTYTVTVLPVTPTASGAETTGLQGQVQEGKLAFTAGDAAVPLTGTPVFDNGQTVKEVEHVGKFELAADGTVTFTPDKTFVGTAEQEVSQSDTNGTLTQATYKVTVTAVTPTASGAETTGLQGQVQEGKLAFTAGDAAVPLTGTPVFDNGQTVKEVEHVGKFELAADGTVTFTPDKTFVGTAEQEVSQSDTNGTLTQATYKVTVTAVTPTAENAVSTGLQGLEQSGKPVFTAGNAQVAIDETIPATFDDGSVRKEEANVGIFTVTADGTVTFTPERTFVGTPAPVTVKRVDTNGTIITATYTPTVTAVTPIGQDATSENIKGKAQSGKPVFTAGDPAVPLDERLLPTFDDGRMEKTVAGEGVYRLDADGTVTFTPEADFVGQAGGVTVLRRDVNGTAVTARYLPTVTEAAKGADTATTGAKGRLQSATPVFEGRIDTTVPATFDDGSREKTISGEGLYTVDSNGRVTFIPDENFVGQGRGVVVQRSDVHGNLVTAAYRPTVIGTAFAENTVSTGLKGQPQTGTPIFSGDIDSQILPTFADGSSEMIVPGEGMYILDPASGQVTFRPEASFVGQTAGVTVVRRDRNGNLLSATYTPTVREEPTGPVNPVTPVNPDPITPATPTEPADQLTRPTNTASRQPAARTESLPRTQGRRSAGQPTAAARGIQAALPNTGSQESSALGAGLLAAAAGLSLLGLAKSRKASEED